MNSLLYITTTTAHHKQKIQLRVYIVSWVSRSLKGTIYKKTVRQQKNGGYSDAGHLVKSLGICPIILFSTSDSPRSLFSTIADNMLGCHRKIARWFMLYLKRKSSRSFTWGTGNSITDARRDIAKLMSKYVPHRDFTHCFEGRSICL